MYVWMEWNVILLPLTWGLEIRILIHKVIDPVFIPGEREVAEAKSTAGASLKKLVLDLQLFLLMPA